MLEKSIIDQPNDYSSQESIFRERTGLQLVGDSVVKEMSATGDQLTSVIIPTYNDSLTLPLIIEQLNRQTGAHFEVIIVDDGSDDPVLQHLKLTSSVIPIKVIRHHKNMGLSHARNTGLLAAQGQTVIFTDADIVFDENFIRRFAARAENTDNCVFLGFKHPIEINDVRHRKPADYRADWRFSVRPNRDYLSLFPESKSYAIPLREYRLLDETDRLKNFGNGATIGFWDLASVVIGHGLCVRRDTAIAVGGYPEQGFSGWGAEDIAFGARLIAHGCYIVPVLSNAYYHVNHPPRSGSTTKQYDELRQNLASYFRMRQATQKFTPLVTRKITAVKTYGHGITVFEVQDDDER